MFKNKTLLITGGTGSFGNAVLRRFLDSEIQEIRIFSRDEKKQDDMRQFYNNPKIKYYIGDVSNYASINSAMKEVDFIEFNIKKMIKKIVKKGLENLGYKIQKIDNRSNFTMFDALKRCVIRGLEIKTVIDIGASDGSWSRECLKFLPSAQYLLIEAQEPHKIGLEKLQKEKKNIDFILAAAGNRYGKIFFENSNLLGGLASETPFDNNCIEVPVVTVDNEILKRRLEGPYLIKMDTHGFEIPIIEGALETLKHSELVIIETYNYQLTKDSLKFYQMCDYMEKKGFSPIDMVDLSLRKYDNSFWQMDIFFVPKGREEFKYNSYE